MLAPGDRVGPYEILSPLGAGGMGEVYRARDSRLKRDVALKILLEGVATDPDRLARFQREAELLATLNHPNIAAIYGMEGTALVLELVDGPTLADRIAQGPMPLSEALPVLGQIIDALEYAHEKGIVHRDLKPANIKLTPDGTVKLLDFGLAKVWAGEAGGAGRAGTVGDPRTSPTMTVRATMAGTILGTAAYMAPEQARGVAIDKRADIWAFGVVAYEMLTGTSLFEGPTVSDTLALVLTKQPELTAVPDRVRPLIVRCLERDPRKRLRDIGDATMLLEESAAREPARIRRSSALALTLGAVALASTIAAGALAFLHLREQPRAARVFRYEIPTGSAYRISAISVSPDGRFLAFIGVQDGMVRLRALASLDTRTIADSAGSVPPLAWSPDSQSFVFVTSGKLRKVDAAGGRPETLADIGQRVFSATWTRDGSLLAAGRDGLMQIPPSGGPGTTLLPTGSGIVAAHVLPDGRHLLFAAGERYVSGITLGIFAGSLDRIESLGTAWKTSKPLATTDSADFVVAAPLDDNHAYVLFLRDGTLFAQRLNVTSLDVVGTPAPLADDVAQFGASRDTLVYRTGVERNISQLRWFDRRGKELGSLGEAANLGNTVLSPDGKTVLVDRIDSGATHLWVGDTARGVFSRLTSIDANETSGALANDGTVVFTATARGSGGLPGAIGDLYAIRPNSSTGELLAQSPFVKHPNDISPDGKYLIYDVHGTERQDLFVLPLNDGTAKPIPFLVTAADETSGQFSPDGKWVAYSSDESGRREVYVRAFLPDHNPASGARNWLVSTAGGEKPHWSRDGRELFYISLDRKMMATPVTIGAAFQPGLPAALFDVRFTGFIPYDVSADGRFLINTPSAAADAAPAPLNVVLNWSAVLNGSQTPRPPR